MPKPSRNIALRFVSHFFIVLLICSQGSIALVQLAHFIHYNEVRSSEWSRNKERDTICVSPGQMSEIVWIKKDEIRYRGRMFDIRSELRKDDSLLIIGHYDLKDDHLLKVVYTLFDENSTKGSSEGQPVKMLVVEAVVPALNIHHIPAFKYYTRPTIVYANRFYELLSANSCFHPPEVTAA